MPGRCSLSTPNPGRTTAHKVAILSRLRKGGVVSVTALAQELDAHRSVISRTLTLLRDSGYAEQEERSWRITAAGESYLSRIVPGIRASIIDYRQRAERLEKALEGIKTP
jgi:DNA-binding transcriptional ArsR family regulator